MHFSMDFRAKSFFRVLISRPGHSSTNLGCQYQRRQGFKLFVFFLCCGMLEQISQSVIGVM